MSFQLTWQQYAEWLHSTYRITIEDAVDKASALCAKQHIESPQDHEIQEFLTDRLEDRRADYDIENSERKIVHAINSVKI